jgi:hypothetical protein
MLQGAGCMLSHVVLPPMLPVPGTADAQRRVPCDALDGMAEALRVKQAAAPAACALLHRGLGDSSGAEGGGVNTAAAGVNLREHPPESTCSMAM